MAVVIGGMSARSALDPIWQKYLFDTTINKRISRFSSPIFQLLHSLGSVLTAPLEGVIGAFQQVRFSEKHVFIKFTGISVMLVASVPALFVAIPGIALRSLTTQISCNPCFYHPTRNLEPSVDFLCVKKLSVMTWNLGLGQDFISIENRLPVPANRFKEIMKYVENEKSNMIAFQEAFDTPTVNRIIERLNVLGYDCVGPALVDGFGLSSGLLIAIKRVSSQIKLIVKEIKIWKFNNLSDLDRVSKKGLLGIKLRVLDTENKKEMTLNLFNTHLQASYETRGYAKVREGQVKAIVEEINEWCQNSENENNSTILCGDFNYSFVHMEPSDKKSDQQKFKDSGKLFDDHLYGEYIERQQYFEKEARLFNSNLEQKGTWIERKKGAVYRTQCVPDFILTSKKLVRLLESDCAFGNRDLHHEIDPMNLKNFPSDHDYVCHIVCLAQLFDETPVFKI